MNSAEPRIETRIQLAASSVLRAPIPGAWPKPLTVSQSFQWIFVAPSLSSHLRRNR